MLDEETLKILTCPKCKQLSKEPMECQSCQQLYCTECQPTICLLCKKQSAFRFSKVAKKIIGDIDIKCPHCSLTVKHGDLEDVHLKSCQKYLIKCKYSACNFEGNKTDFTNHILNNHVAEVLDSFTNPLVEEIEKLEHVIPTKDYIGGKQKSNVSQSMFIPPSSINLNPKMQNLLWSNNSKVFVKVGKGKYLISSSMPISLGSVSIRFGPCKDHNYNMVGFSNKMYMGEALYIGGETTGEWGIAGNGIIGVDKKWIKEHASVFKFTNDLVTLKYDNGTLGLMVEGKHNTYSYFLGSRQVYLTICLYHDGDTCTIVS